MKVRKLAKHRALLSARKHWHIVRMNGRLTMWWQSPTFHARGGAR
jgi:hypothetical protein